MTTSLSGVDADAEEAYWRNWFWDQAEEAVNERFASASKRDLKRVRAMARWLALLVSLHATHAADARDDFRYHCACHKVGGWRQSAVWVESVDLWSQHASQELWCCSADCVDKMYHDGDGVFRDTQKSPAAIWRPQPARSWLRHK